MWTTSTKLKNSNLARSKNWRDEQVQFFVPEENENAMELIEKYYLIKSKSGNTWLSLGKKFEFQSKKIVSILDFCVSVC